MISAYKVLAAFAVLLIAYGLDSLYMAERSAEKGRRIARRFRIVSARDWHYSRSRFGR